MASMEKRTTLVLTVALVAALGLAAESNYRITARYPVPGTGGWDYITLDEAARRLYIGHSTQVEVLDADTGKVIGTITDTPGVHGAAIAAPFRRGFTSNGRENTVSMFDPATLKVIRKINVGKGPDGIYYHAASKRIFTNNHGSHDVTAIDAESGKVVGTVKLEGDGEQAVTGVDGMIYVDSEDTAEVVVFDPVSLAVKRRMPIGVAQTPTALAYDAATNRLFIGCREKPVMVVMDAANGKVIASFPIGGGVDAAAFDPKTKMAFFACGEGTLNFFHEKSANQIEAGAVVKTQPSARTMAFDSRTGRIFLPAAEFVETPAAGAGKRPQRAVKPGSFLVLVVSR